MQKQWVIIIYLIFLAGAGMSQDAHFSRFYSNALYMAPSFAGSAGLNRFAASYRNQWPEVNVGYKTYSVSYDHYFNKLNSGLGVLFLRDEAGSGNLSTTNISLLYSFDFKVTNLIHIRPGMSLQYAQRSIDFNKLLWADQMSVAGNAPSSGEVTSFNNVGDIDFSSSILAYNDEFWAGFAVDHLLRPNQSLYYEEYERENLALVPIKYQLFGGYKITMKDKLLRPIPTVLQIAFLYKKQAEFKQMDWGLYWYYNPIVLGIWYRGVPLIKGNKTNDAIVLLVGFKTKSYNIGYSYDFTVSKLITSTSGSHEISLAYSFGKPAKHRPSHKMVPCPDL